MQQKAFLGFLHFAQRQIGGALHGKNGPFVTELQKEPLVSPVFVYRIHCAEWAGLFFFLDHRGETCTVMDTDGPKSPRSTVVKQFVYHPLGEQPEKLTSQKADAAQSNQSSTKPAPHITSLATVEQTSPIAVIIRNISVRRPKSFV